MTPAQLVNGLAAHGVQLSASGGRRLRAVLNYHIEAADVDHILAAFRTTLAGDVVVDGAKVVAYG
ncbi:MAG: hypothetical protein R2932_57440 [Caldilineaceae bacterium]